MNAVLLHGRALGPSLVYGRGAGDLPTAVSVVADILDVARSMVAGVAGLQTRGIAMEPRKLRAMDDVVTRFYLRFTVLDRPGVMGKLASALGEQGVSIEHIVQEGAPGAAGSPACVVMITRAAREGGIRRAFEAIASEGVLAGPSRLLRIEEA
jgi:homoserine dehydrogenase